ncbi:MAG: succinate dehydrogenase, hydrophobic membrane anchor protein [Gammaproteobacteria bacterium]
MDYRSPLALAQGLGSAKSGTGHWWMQRVTALALIPLTYVVLKFIDLSLHAPYDKTVDWLSSPVNSVCLIVWLLAVFYHSALGLRVVIEDYVGSEAGKILSIWAVNLVFLFLAIAALIAVLRILLIG